MKNEKIGALFRKERNLQLFNRLHPNGSEEVVQQYISNGCALYTLENLPMFDSENIWALLGADMDIHGDCAEMNAPAWLMNCLNVYDDDNLPVTPYPYQAFGLQVLHTHHNSPDDGREDVCIFIDPKFLVPIADEKYELWYRDIDGRQLVIASAGVLIKAVIAPVVFRKDLIKEKIDFIATIYKELNTINPNVKIETPYEQVGFNEE